MAAFGAAMNAVRDIMLMQARLDLLQGKVEEQSGNQKALAASVVEIDRRLARVEGLIEGVAMASRSPRSLPKE